MDSLIFKPPMNIAKRDMTKKYVFLAGSIEMGKAEDWQAEMTEFFNLHDWGVFNPRRDDWDSSWKQDISDPQFLHQVNWELDHLDKADIILMYFLPETKSPISLLELGRYADSGKMIVCCPEGFWRRGNVQILCDRFSIPLYDRFNEAMNLLINHLIFKIIKKQ